MPTVRREAGVVVRAGKAKESGPTPLTVSTWLRCSVCQCFKLPSCGVGAECGKQGCAGRLVVAERQKPAVADLVNHPPHYKSGGLEAIDVIEAFGLGYRVGNAVKYLLRADRKGARRQDLEKAAWYIARELEKGVQS